MALNNEDLPKLVELLNLIDIRVKVRRKTAADWTASNEVLLSGEWGKETDTGKMKQGNGVSGWNALAYFGGGGSLLDTIAPLQGGGYTNVDLELSIDPATRATPGSMSAADKVIIDSVNGDGVATQVGATLMQVGSGSAPIPSSSTLASVTITFPVPYTDVKGVFIEPTVGEVSASGDAATHYVVATNTNFTVYFKSVANINKIITFKWMATGSIPGTAVAALHGTYKRVRIGVPTIQDLVATGGDGTFLLYGSDGVYSGDIPAGLSLAVVSGSLLRLSGTCSEAAPGFIYGTVAVVTGDGQMATSAQVFDVRNAYSPATALFASGERGIWLDPQDLSSMFQDTAGTVPVTAAGQQVARINDKSGNNNHVTQATLVNRPYLRHDGINYYLEFDSANSRYMSAPNTNLLAPRTNSIMMVVGSRFTTPTTAQYMVARSLQGPGANRYWMSQGITGNNAAFNYSHTSGDIAAPVAPNGSGDNTVVSGTIDRMAGSAVVRVNAIPGTEVSFTSDTATDRNTAYTFMLGVYPNSSDTGPASGTYVTGRLYGLVLRFADIDTAKRLELEEWMSEQCNAGF